MFNKLYIHKIIVRFIFQIEEVFENRYENFSEYTRKKIFRFQNKFKSQKKYLVNGRTFPSEGTQNNSLHDLDLLLHFWDMPKGIVDR